jgi:hypothetical protein
MTTTIPAPDRALEPMERDNPLLLERMRAAERLCGMMTRAVEDVEEGRGPMSLVRIRELLASWEAARREHQRAGGVRK